MNFITRFTLFIVVFTCMQTGAIANLSGQRLVGTATDLKTGEPVYTEEHLFSATGNSKTMLSRYTSPTDQLIAKRQIEYVQGQVESYEFEQMPLGYRESAERTKDAILVKKQKDQSPLKSQAIDLADKPTGKELVIDAGFNDYVLRNWDALMQGERKRFDFVSAARLTTIGFRVRMDKKNSKADMVVFSMTPSNPVIRLLLAPIKVGFYQDTRQLAYYRGISNLRDDEGKPLTVEINFDNGQLAG